MEHVIVELRLIIKFLIRMSIISVCLYFVISSGSTLLAFAIQIFVGALGLILKFLSGTPRWIEHNLVFTVIWSVIILVECLGHKVLYCIIGSQEDL